MASKKKFLKKLKWIESEQERKSGFRKIFLKMIFVGGKVCLLVHSFRLLYSVKCVLYTVDHTHTHTLGVLSSENVPLSRLSRSYFILLLWFLYFRLCILSLLQLHEISPKFFHSSIYYVIFHRMCLKCISKAPAMMHIPTFRCKSK